MGGVVASLVIKKKHYKRVWIQSTIIGNEN